MSSKHPVAAEVECHKADHHDGPQQRSALPDGHRVGEPRILNSVTVDDITGTPCQRSSLTFTAGDGPVGCAP